METIGLPVRSAVLKLCAGRLVVGLGDHQRIPAVDCFYCCFCFRFCPCGRGEEAVIVCYEWGGCVRFGREGVVDVYDLQIWSMDVLALYHTKNNCVVELHD
jgi:hypothetical protein